MSKKELNEVNWIVDLLSNQNTIKLINITKAIKLTTNQLNLIRTFS
jgi:hypothetical protein